jgi:hypothetical protein
MVDIFRYGMAMFVVLGTVHIVGTIVWYPIAFIFSLLTMPWAHAKPTKYFLGVFNTIKFFLLIGIGAQLQAVWTKDYPNFNGWFSLISITVFACYPIKGYVTKKWQEEALRQRWKAARDSFDTDGQIFDDYATVKEMAKGFKVGAIMGILMSITYLFNSSLFITQMTMTVKELASSVWRLPIVPILLAMVGFEVIFNWRKRSIY